MRELRIGSWAAAAAVIAAFGCDNGGGGGTDAGRADTGVTVMDSGPTPDSGSPPDTGTDAGGAGTCRPALSECDLLLQDCPAGQSCRYLRPAEGGEPRGLCEAAGTRTEGESCTRDAGDTCAEGLICWEGVCRKWCCGSNTHCSLGQFCVGTPVGLCFEGTACNPLDGSGCETAGQACYPVGPDNLCQTEGTAATGESCAGVGCVRGNACLDPAAPTCFALCDIPGGGTGCPDGQTCSGRINDGTGAARTDVGFCMPTP